MGAGFIWTALSVKELLRYLQSVPGMARWEEQLSKRCPSLSWRTSKHATLYDRRKEDWNWRYGGHCLILKIRLSSIIGVAQCNLKGPENVKGYRRKAQGDTRRIPTPAIVLKRRSGCRQSTEASKGSEEDSPPGLPKQTLILIHILNF